MRQFLAVSLFVLFSASAFASDVVAEGKVIYKMPGGELVTRDASLQVPTMGKGDVILSSGGFEAKSAAFGTFKSRGQTIFSVVFPNPPGAPKGSAGLFRGTYLRGSNQAVYYGDFYGKTLSEKEALMTKAAWEEILRKGDIPEGFEHYGGFGFSASTN